MGTSTRWPGPRGGVWVAPNTRLGWVDTLTAGGISAVPSDSAADPAQEPRNAAAEQQLVRAVEQVADALFQTIRVEPDAFDLRLALSAAGANLVNVLEDLSTTGATVTEDLPEGTAAARETAYIQWLVCRVCGAGGTATDSVIRRSAVYCGRYMLDNDRFRRAIDGEDAGYRLSGELLCEVYQLFFAQAFEEFLKSLVTAKIVLWLPILQVIDPAGVIADWVADNIVKHIPNPCEEAAGRGGHDASLPELARGLLEETVRRVLGLPVGTTGGS
ncbi:hypothetical protein ACFYV7_17675 [Nocardia suismassiliense]|uniref:TetR family transcriptional regulator n=1 Tax=Nocardia suismassiliense TaxID=2077092 RepID=A0ABW6QTT7_9NOCA